MIILGLDPGTHRTGYAVIDVRGSQVSVLEAGTWYLVDDLKLGLTKRSSLPPLGARLEQLWKHSEALLKKYNPRYVGIEKAVYHKNVVSALILAQARGVLLASLFHYLGDAERRLIELSPTYIKKVFVGSGRAVKEDVRKILALRVPSLKEDLKNNLLNHDAIDALAIAWSTWVFTKTQKQESEARCLPL